MKHHDDLSVDRRQTLKCMVWAGTGLVWTLNGGVPTSALIGSAQAAPSGFSFVQISDSHIGFDEAGKSRRTSNACGGYRQSWRAS